MSGTPGDVPAPRCQCDAHNGLPCPRDADYLITRAGRRMAVCGNCTLTGDGVDDRDLNPDWAAFAARAPVPVSAPPASVVPATPVCVEPCEPGLADPRLETCQWRPPFVSGPGGPAGVVPGEGPATAWLIVAAHLSTEGVTYFWGPNCSGYTADLDKAGRYTEADAKRKDVWSERKEVAVPFALAEAKAFRAVRDDDAHAWHRKRFPGPKPDASSTPAAPILAAQRGPASDECPSCVGAGLPTHDPETEAPCEDCAGAGTKTVECPRCGRAPSETRGKKAWCAACEMHFPVDPDEPIAAAAQRGPEPVAGRLDPKALLADVTTLLDHAVRLLRRYVRNAKPLSVNCDWDNGEPCTDCRTQAFLRDNFGADDADRAAIAALAAEGLGVK